jgi:hypothetical protein
MTSGDSNEQNFSVSVPVGAAVAAILLAGATAAAYLIIGRPGMELGSEGGPAKSGSSFMRKIGLLGLVAMIENDATRKVVVAVLKAMAKRA